MEFDVPGWGHVIHCRLVAPRRISFVNSLADIGFHHTGMRGIYTTNSTLAPTGLPRIRLAYQNMASLAEMVGSDLNSCVRLVVYTTDMYRYRPLCNQVQIELWGNDANKYPPRTIIEVGRLNDDDIVEVEGTFHLKAENTYRRG